MKVTEETEEMNKTSAVDVSQPGVLKLSDLNRVLFMTYVLFILIQMYYFVSQYKEYFVSVH